MIGNCVSWPAPASVAGGLCYASYPPQCSAVETAERLAEGDVIEQLEVLRAAADTAAATAPEFEQFAYLAAAAVLGDAAQEAARTAITNGQHQAERIAAFELAPGENEAAAVARAAEDEGRAQAALVNELFGNPFRPSTIEPHWLAFEGGVVGHMAAEIEQRQRFEELPYLADALTDAGSTEEALLRHLRRVGGHVRGCWALDLLTAKG